MMADENVHRELKNNYTSSDIRYVECEVVKVDVCTSRNRPALFGSCAAAMMPRESRP